ncbi:MAG: hypothetical protein J5725_08715 [Bacteroidales bacterium]|nr:hypothetical protein [Bacteroidales bacterium]
MATRITGTYSGGSTYIPYIDWSITSQSITNNTSTISVTFGMRKVKYNDSTYDMANTSYLVLSINGVRYPTSGSYTTNFDFRNEGYPSDHTIKTISGIVINHNTDGTKSISISATHTTDTSLSVGSVSGTAVLTKIIRGKPTAALTVTPNNANTGIQSSWGSVYVKGLTKVHYSITGTPNADSGAGITNYEFVGNGETKTGSYSNPPITGDTTNALKSSGNVSVKARVKDNNAIWSEEATQTISVYDYAPPKISNVQVFRCNQSGTELVTGTYASIKASATTDTTIGGHNRIEAGTFTYSIAESTSPSTPIKSGTLTNNTAVIIPESGDTFTIELDKTYVVTISAIDTIGTTTTSTASIPIALTTLSLKEGGKGVAFSKIADTENAVDFGSWHPIGYIMGLGKAKAAVNGDADNCLVPGVYSVSSDSVAGGTSNLPSSYGGVLRVWNAMGSENIGGGTWYYLVQEYIDWKANVFYRAAHSEGTAGTYTWGSWKQVTMTTVTV